MVKNTDRPNVDIMWKFVICFNVGWSKKKNQKNKNKKAQHHRTDDSRIFCRSCAYACNSKTIEMKSKTRTFLAYLRRLAWDGNEIK